MNGAIADPWLSTMSPPKAALMMKIGNSQNFLRTRMKSHNSPRNDTGTPVQNWFFIVSGAGPGGSRAIQ